MDDPGFRSHVNLEAETSDPFSQIGILGVEKKSLIESSHFSEEGALDQKTLETSFFHMTQVNQVREYLNERFAEVNHEESLIKLNYTTGARAKLYTDTINIYQMDNQKAAQEEIERLSDINKIVLSGEYPSNLHHSYNRSYTKFYTHVHQYLKDHFKKTS